MGSWAGLGAVSTGQLLTQSGKGTQLGGALRSATSCVDFGWLRRSVPGGGEPPGVWVRGGSDQRVLEAGGRFGQAGGRLHHQPDTEGEGPQQVDRDDEVERQEDPAKPCQEREGA